VIDPRARQPIHDEASQDKAKETQHPSLPILAPDEIKSRQGNARPRQHAAEKPNRRPFRRNTPENRAPKAAEEKRAEQ
jgi:hypothetical protein